MFAIKEYHHIIIEYRINNRKAVEILEILCEKGADINLQNKNGETALMFEIKRFSNNTEVVEILCEKGANVNL